MKAGDNVYVTKGSEALGFRKGMMLKVLRIVEQDGGGSVVFFDRAGRTRQLFNRRSPECIAQRDILWFNNGDPTLRIRVQSTIACCVETNLWATTHQGES